MRTTENGQEAFIKNSLDASPIRYTSSVPSKIQILLYHHQRSRDIAYRHKGYHSLINQRSWRILENKQNTYKLSNQKVGQSKPVLVEQMSN